MANSPLIRIIGVRCRPDQEEKYNKWHSEVHVPLLFKFKGVKKVTRCKILSPGRTYAGFPEVDYPNYLTIYEFEDETASRGYESSPELAEATKEAKETWGDDFYGRVWLAGYEVLNTWQK